MGTGASSPADTGEKHTHGLIALSMPELHKLLSHLLWHTSQTIEHVLHWSAWRRRHHQMLAK